MGPEKGLALGYERVLRSALSERVLQLGLLRAVPRNGDKPKKELHTRTPERVGNHLWISARDENRACHRSHRGSRNAHCRREILPEFGVVELMKEL